ncbi:hypothetical protein C0Z01_14130 [Photobacterium kishitanii]|nr:hypothetical protein AYY22_20975 [Photobacterium kishitanii]PSW68695.1 hypothetical protein C0Z01_14130 [Photobacterium kishitanii]
MFTSHSDSINGLISGGGSTAQMLIAFGVFKQLSINKRLIASVENIVSRVDRLENKVDMIQISK